LACAKEVSDGVLVMIADLPSTASELLEEVDSALMSKYELLEDCSVEGSRSRTRCFWGSVNACSKIKEHRVRERDDPFTPKMIVYSNTYAVW